MLFTIVYIMVKWNTVLKATFIWYFKSKSFSIDQYFQARKRTLQTSCFSRVYFLRAIWVAALSNFHFAKWSKSSKRNARRPFFRPKTHFISIYTCLPFIALYWDWKSCVSLENTWGLAFFLFLSTKKERCNTKSWK